LARALVARFSEKFKRGPLTVSAGAIRVLEAFPWPGNIRQLENALQQAVLTSTGPELLPEHLSPAVCGAPSTPAGPGGSPSPEAPPSLAEQRGEQERRVIGRALAEANNCRSRTARALGISRVTLYNKMKKYGLLEGSRPWPRSARGNGEGE
jgi:two-component system NtrC family response regulator